MTTETTKKLKPIWKCLVKGCNFTAPPTARGYKQMTGHMLGHANKGLGKEKRKYALIDEDTGNVLAQKITEAKEKGLLVAEEEEKPQPTAEKPEAKEEEIEEGREVREPTEPFVTSEGIFRYTVTLPSDAFTLFNLAKFSGLEKDSDMPFDEWLWDCIRKRYEKDYKMRLVLAPLEEL